jgi:hypothetical protein
MCIITVQKMEVNAYKKPEHCIPSPPLTKKKGKGLQSTGQVARFNSHYQFAPYHDRYKVITQ